MGDDHVDFMTRGLKWQDGKLPYVEKELLQIFPSGTVLDGEVVALRSATAEEIAAGKPGLVNDFEHVQSIMLSLPDEAVMKAKTVRPLRYMVFDRIGDFAGLAPNLPFSIRRSILKGNFAGRKFEHVELSPQVEATQANHDAWVASGLEGTVAKRKDSTYGFGKRDKRWIKIKATWTMDAIIVGFIPGRGKNKGKVGSLVFAQPTEDPDHREAGTQFELKLIKAMRSQYDKGQIEEVWDYWWGYAANHGMAIRGCARGFDDPTMDAMTADPESYMGRVVEISHNGEMQGGTKLRHPQFIRFRDPADKPASAVDWRSR